MVRRTRARRPMIAPVRIVAHAFAAAALSVTVLACSDAPSTVQGGEPRFDPSPPVLTGGKCGTPTWTCLYRDYFGPNAASCGKGGCHASAGNVWVCGSSADTCYMGVQAILEKGVKGESTSLYTSLRTVAAKELDGKMPQDKLSFVFAPEDLARIRTWIDNGAKND